MSVAATAVAGCAVGADATPTWIAMAAQTEVNAVWGAADDDAWIVGSRGGECVIARWNGVRATEIEHPPCGPALAVRGTSASDVWITTGGRESALQVLHWDGSALTVRYSEPAPARMLLAISTVGAGDVWFAGGTSRGESAGGGGDYPWVLHWDGARWDESPALRLQHNGSTASYARAIVARANGELWIEVPQREHWRHAAGAPLDQWTVASEPANGGAATVLVDAADGGVWTAFKQINVWDGGAGSFVRASEFGDAPATLQQGIALDREHAWFATELGVGPERCTSSGSAFSGISVNCGPSQRLAAIARWNGAAWSTTTLPEAYANARVAWREPTSGALWVRAMGKIGRLEASQLR